MAGSGCADDEGASGGFDDVVGDYVEVVDLEDAFDLREEAFEEPEVAAGGAFDGGEGLRVGEVVKVECFAEFAPVAFEDELEFVMAECPVLVGEAETAIELRVVAELFIDATRWTAADAALRQTSAATAAAPPIRSTEPGGSCTRRRRRGAGRDPVPGPCPKTRSPTP